MVVGLASRTTSGLARAGYSCLQLKAYYQSVSTHTYLSRTKRGGGQGVTKRRPTLLLQRTKNAAAGAGEVAWWRRGVPEA